MWPRRAAGLVGAHRAVQVDRAIGRHARPEPGDEVDGGLGLAEMEALARSQPISVRADSTLKCNTPTGEVSMWGSEPDPVLGGRDVPDRQAGSITGQFQVKRKGRASRIRRGDASAWLTGIYALRGASC